MNRPLLMCLAASVCCLFLVHTAAAIPAFARKYDMSCTTCHSPAPRLKPFGDQFAGNGFRLEGQEPARYFRETGDGLLQLMREFPAAVRFEGYVEGRSTDGRRADFQTPYLIKLLSGGQISTDLSYYFYFFLGERGTVAGLEDAFIMYNNLFGHDLDIYIGQFQVSDPLFKRELRLTREDYAIYSTRVGLASADLTYERGIMVTLGLPSGTDIVAEVVNGSGIGPADAGEHFDADGNKNGILRVSQEIGDAFRIGGFGYYGEESGAGVTNTTKMVGPDVSVTFDKLQINGQYVLRTDSRPNFTLLRDAIATSGGFVEAVFTPDGDQSRWYGVLLFNMIDSDIASMKYRSLTGSVQYLLSRNFRLLGEVTYEGESKATRASVGFVTAF